MPAASEQISVGVAPIDFVGAPIQAARCRLLAHRLEGHVTAVTASINFHDRFPGISPIGMDDSCFPTRLIVASGS